MTRGDVLGPPKILAELGLDAEYPPLCRADQQIGVLDAAAAVATGLPTNFPSMREASNLAATTVGVGAGEAGRLSVTLARATIARHP